MNTRLKRIGMLGLGISMFAGFSAGNAQEAMQEKETLLNAPPVFVGDMQGPPPGGMASPKNISSFKGAYMIEGAKGEVIGKSISVNESDKNGILIKNGAQLTLENVRLNKSGHTTSDDGSNFNGQNAVLLAAGNSIAQICDSELRSDSEGANAIFATGSKTKVTVKNVKIHTTANSSRGLDATYNGTILADNVYIITEGAHCAPVATDRGEGTIVVTKAVLSASGEGSPCVYSTGNITINDSIGTAAGSECAVVEGKNSITLNKTSLTGSVKNGVMLYQSFSGDADTGKARFWAKDSALTSKAAGAMFYITNTQAEAVLENTNLMFSSGVLAEVTSDRWGKTGANGGDFSLTGIRQELAGDILANSISTVTVNLTQNTKLEGAVNKENTAKKAALLLDASSSWNVTADSYVTVFKDADQRFNNIKTNGHTIYYSIDEKENSWLGGQTYQLSDGGKLTPYTKTISY